MTHNEIVKTALELQKHFPDISLIHLIELITANVLMNMKYGDA